VTNYFFFCHYFSAKKVEKEGILTLVKEKMHKTGGKVFKNTVARHGIMVLQYNRKENTL